jgi:ribosome biogenesis GTPase / thiamine phosphate phosphatase
MVGGSSPTNRLCEAEVLKTAPIRWDGRGRHTTTHRELVLVPSGGLLIDTPGMRELQLWDPGAGLEEAFEDIDAIAAGCKFRDCEHDREPDCAGRMAVDSGELDPARLASWQKLKRELRHLELRRDARARADERKKYRTMNKSIRAKYQTNGKKGWR